MDRNGQTDGRTDGQTDAAVEIVVYMNLHSSLMKAIKAKNPLENSPNLAVANMFTILINYIQLKVPFTYSESFSKMGVNVILTDFDANGI